MITGERIPAVPGVPHWAQPYLGVACLLHMLWFFTALMWLAAVYLRTSHHRHDELSRALSKQEAVHAKARPSLSQCSVLQAPFSALLRTLRQAHAPNSPHGIVCTGEEALLLVREQHL